MELPVLTTARLKLVPWRDGDLDRLHAMWTDPGVRRYLWDDAVITREQAVEVLQSHFDTVRTAGLGYWCIYEAAGSEAVGFCGFRPIDGGPDMELMYGLLPPWWGRGYATEASAAALAYFWNATGFDRVFARTDPPNAASIRVMRRLGMSLESATGTLVTYTLKRASTASGTSV